MEPFQRVCSIYIFLCLLSGLMSMDPAILPEFTCDFDNDMCGYTTSKGALTWQRSSGSVNGQNFSTVTGSFVYINASGSSGHVNLTSPSSNATGDYCLHFAYFAYGGTVGTLEVYRQGQTKPIFSSRDKSQEKGWRNVAIPLSLSHSPSSITFKGVISSGVNSDLALDSVIVIPGKCDAQRLMPEYSCSFEEVLCNYTQDTGDLKWNNQNAEATQDIRSGPSRYILLNATAIPDLIKKVKLKSSPTDGKGDLICFRFWYYGEGEGTSTLSAHLDDDDFFSTHINADGKIWRYAQKSVFMATEKNTSVEIDVSIKKQDVSSTSEIGLGNIRVTREACLLPKSCGDDNDDYKKDIILCSWVNSQKAAVPWRLIGPGPLPKPIRNMTTLRTFAYIVGSSTQAGQMAILEENSQDVDPQPPGYFCFQFYYYMQGSEGGTLRIALVPEKGNGNDVTEAEQKVIWEVTSQGDAKWQRGLVAVSSTEAFRVLIIGIVGKNKDSVIAIDDVSFIDDTDLPCALLPPTALPQPPTPHTTTTSTTPTKTTPTTPTKTTPTTPTKTTSTTTPTKTTPTTTPTKTTPKTTQTTTTSTATHTTTSSTATNSTTSATVTPTSTPSTSANWKIYLGVGVAIVVVAAVGLTFGLFLYRRRRPRDQYGE